MAATLDLDRADAVNGRRVERAAEAADASHQRSNASSRSHPAGLDG
jgi:hypothetical protein